MMVPKIGEKSSMAEEWTSKNKLELRRLKDGG
jgi:hypothetical protein